MLDSARYELLPCVCVTKGMQEGAYHVDCARCNVGAYDNERFFYDSYEKFVIQNGLGETVRTIIVPT